MIPVNPWQRNNINRTRKVAQNIGTDRVVRVELQINWSMIRVKYILKELISTEMGGRVTEG